MKNMYIFAGTLQRAPQQKRMAIVVAIALGAVGFISRPDVSSIVVGEVFLSYVCCELVVSNECLQNRSTLNLLINQSSSRVQCLQGLGFYECK